MEICTIFGGSFGKVHAWFNITMPLKSKGGKKKIIFPLGLVWIGAPARSPELSPLHRQLESDREPGYTSHLSRSALTYGFWCPDTFGHVAWIETVEIHLHVEDV